MSLRPEDAARYGLNQPNLGTVTLIDRADTEIDIREIYTEMGFYAPSGEYNSWKIHCPFGDEHADGGLDKNCRLYPDTNNIYCWDSHGYLTTTRLYARWKGMPRMRAAEILLENRGLLKRTTWRERWNDLVDYREAKHEARTGLGSQAYVVQALREAISADPRYEALEFTARVRDEWTLVLAALDVVWSSEKLTVEVLHKWLEIAKARLGEALDEAEVRP